MEKLKFIIITIFRIFVGSVFVFSAFTKLYPIEPLEFELVDLGIFSWSVAPFIARFFISFELILGLMLILNVKTKLVSKIVVGVLIFFTFYLIYKWFNKGENSDCGCFGEFLKLNTKESIIKNIILLLPSTLLIFINYPFKIKYQKLIIYSIIIISLATPFVLNDVSAITYSDEEFENNNIKFDTEKLGDFIYKNEIIKLDEGKKIICFFSLTCEFCQLSAKKLTIMKQKSEIDLPIYYVLGGAKDNLGKFWDDTQSYEFPYMFLPETAENIQKFFGMSGPILPSIYLVENGIIKKRLHFGNLNQDLIEDFIKK